MNGSSSTSAGGAKAKSATARKAERTKDAAAAARHRPLWRRLLRLALISAAVVFLAPVFLVPLFTVVPPVGTYMIATRLADGPIERQWVPFQDIARVLAVSVMVSEDARFCEHGGVDWGAIGEVVDRPGGPQRGASTIAMQTARNLFLWQARSYIRKGLEIPLALYADAVWGKRRTMEIYLNIAQWGPGIFGIEAAAQHYFGRSASDLDARQAALLAVTLPNPILRDPANPSRGMQSLARTIEARARLAGPYIVCLYP